MKLDPVVMTVAIFAGYLLVNVGVSVSTQADCLALSYPNSKVTIGFKQYCIKRVDQTDIVVPLAELQRAPR